MEHGMTDYTALITDLRRRADAYRDSLCRRAAVALEDLLANQCKCPPVGETEARERLHALEPHA
jgi:hypothetical protein